MDLCVVEGDEVALGPPFHLNLHLFLYTGVPRVGKDVYSERRCKLAQIELQFVNSEAQHSFFRTIGPVRWSF